MKKNDLVSRVLRHGMLWGIIVVVFLTTYQLGMTAVTPMIHAIQTSKNGKNAINSAQYRQLAQTDKALHAQWNKDVAFIQSVNAQLRSAGLPTVPISGQIVTPPPAVAAVPSVQATTSAS
ncbi:hypothetical protein [Ferroacidibacillus organovorans]|uniref:Uncharacterized protein n=1 Tax=Ferroacidibacillus organovorans TaxID=1765683 RepID=A0A117SYE3_9BACL|nr:hypothetical protein [Ferroacidibacillus organovorans]KUO96814.1 hypothetical protein ATW55_08365 [Ferroacidibacillus organovorans]